MLIEKICPCVGKTDPTQNTRKKKTKLILKLCFNVQVDDDPTVDSVQAGKVKLQKKKKIVYQYNNKTLQ